jgi:TolA-binding protein
MAEEKYEDARKDLGELLNGKNKPDNLDEVAYHHAMCAMELEQFNSAIQEFEQFRKRWPDAAEATDSIYRQGYCLYRLKQYKDSLELCRKAAAKGDDPIAIPAAELAAENLFLMEQYDQAVKTLESVIDALKDRDAKPDPGRLRLLRFRIGQCHYYDEDYKAAIESLAWLKDSDDARKTPQLWGGVLLVGDAQLKTEQHDDAIETLKTFLDHARDNKKPEARFKLALAQLGADKTDDARRTLRELTDDKAKGPWVRRGRLQYAQLLYDDDKLDDAGKQLRTLLEVDPDKDLRAPALYLMGWVDMRQDRHALAAKRFNELIEKSPEHPQAPDARFQKGSALQQNGSWDSARDALEAYIKKHPKGEHVPRARYLVGVCLAEQDKHGEAMKIFATLAGDKETASENVLYKLAWAAREQKDPNTAKAAYRSLLKDYPKTKLATHARAELAGMLYVDKQYAPAAELLEPVVKNDKTPEEILPVAIYRLGSCYARLNKHEQAAKALDVFQKQFTKHKLAPSGLYRAAVAYLEIEKPDPAGKLLATLLKRHGKHDLAAPALLKLGEAQAASNDFDKAHSTYTTFIKKYPKYERLYFAQFGAGWSAQNLNKYDEARTWYKKVIDDHNGPTAARAQFQLGETYFAEKKFEKAAGELLKVDIVYDYPKWSARALYEAGMAFENLKQYAQAKKQYLACRKRFPKTAPAQLASKRLDVLAKAGY